MGLRRSLEAGAVGTALLLPFAPLMAAQTIYCCDVGGQPVCSDVLPPACYGQAYREIGPQGTIRKKVPAPPSASDIARRNAEAERLKEEEARATKVRRLDQALLQTYTSVTDLDHRRDRALADIDRTLDELREREERLLERRKALLPEQAGQKAKPQSRAQAEALRDLDSELAAHRSVVDAKVREREGVRQRYAEDRERYLELTGAQKAAPRQQEGGKPEGAQESR
ncbi:hypothetical protein dqs_3807 [Azoarcus olearius]|uniref:DUF4124 domain-containing protein n=1 Tax=Azoarcus sp. (strain BH72) TaxID=418699 RepID=UPI00080611CF|nr:DUF4124 domain-containing protein [Azoarcus olearius]ANQ86824.1 hypothetical protein dqs_3807 [Azoarcus olearius]